MWVAILCHLPQYEYGSWVPKPGYEAQPSTWVVGSRDPYEYWGRWHNFCKTYLICILAQVLEIILIPYYWHFVSEGGSVSSSCKWKPVIRSPAHNPILLQLPIRLHSMTLADIQGIKTEFNTFCCGCHLHSSLTTLATSTLLLVSTVLCVFRMLDGANWHEAPWKPGLCTFWLWSGHYIQHTLTSKAVIQIYIFWPD